MASEVRRGLQRIIANYGRLVGWLILGVVVVPVVTGWIGFEALGLISLLGATVGFAGPFLQLTSQGLVRDLGRAYHRSEANFREVYASCFVIAGVMAVLVTVVLGVIYAVLGLFQIPDEWLQPARICVAAQGVWLLVLLLLSPAFTMYRVQEQFGRLAFWMVARRACLLAAVLILAFGVRVTDVPTAITSLGLLWSGLLIVVEVSSVAALLLADRRLIPSFSRIRRRSIRRGMLTFGWNAAVHIAMGLYERLTAVLMNLAFGLLGNAIFDVAHRLVSYVRMTTVGVTFGLEAVSVRVSAGEEDGAVARMLHHYSRVQSFVAFPAGLAVFIFADALLDLWIGRQVENPDQVIPAAATIVRILAMAIVARAISDGWIMILFGAGYVRRYAPLVLAGGIACPIVGGLLLWAMSGLPDSIRLHAPAIGYALVFTIVHLLLLPFIGARCLHVRYRDLFIPLVRPAVVTALCAPILIVPDLLGAPWTPWRILAGSAAYGLAYAILTWILVLDAAERQRFASAARRRLVRARPRDTG